MKILHAIYCSFCILIYFFVLNLSFFDSLLQNNKNLLFIFIATITAIIFNITSIVLISFCSITACIITKTLTPNQALSGFENELVWFVFLTFSLSNAFVKSNLGTRIANSLIKNSKNILQIAYALILCDVILAPFIPSASARGGGIIIPIIKSATTTLPKKSQDFLLLISSHAMVISSTMFLTAMAANPLIIKIINLHNISISWINWFLAALLPGITSLVLMPVILFHFQKPDFNIVLNFEETTVNKISKKEILIMCIFGGLIILWGDFFGLHLSLMTSALIALIFLLCFNIISVEDILKNHKAWEMFIWFGLIIMFSEFLVKFGLFDFLKSKLEVKITGFSFFELLILYFYIHYFFISSSLYINLMLPLFLNLLLKIDGNITTIYNLVFFSILSACLTHLGLSSSPMFFAETNFSIKTWWKFGLIISFCYIVIWFGLGNIWLETLQCLKFI